MNFYDVLIILIRNYCFKPVNIEHNFNLKRKKRNAFKDIKSEIIQNRNVITVKLIFLIVKDSGSHGDILLQYA